MKSEAESHSTGRDLVTPVTSSALTPIPGSPFAAGYEPYSVGPTAKFFYVANFSSNNVSGYGIGSNGALTPVSGSSFAMGVGPV